MKGKIHLLHNLLSQLHNIPHFSFNRTKKFATLPQKPFHMLYGNKFIDAKCKTYYIIFERDSCFCFIIDFKLDLLTNLTDSSLLKVKNKCDLNTLKQSEHISYIKLKYYFHLFPLDNLL